MCKFIVITGRNLTPGTAGMSYHIHGKISFDPKKDIENQMRKYSYRYFYDKGKNPSKFRSEIFCRRRHIFNGDGTIFAERIKLFEHYISNEIVGFIPIECFEF